MSLSAHHASVRSTMDSKNASSAIMVCHTALITNQGIDFTETQHSNGHMPNELTNFITYPITQKQLGQLKCWMVCQLEDNTLIGWVSVLQNKVYALSQRLYMVLSPPLPKNIDLGIKEWKEKWLLSLYKWWFVDFLLPFLATLTSGYLEV